MPGSAPHIQRGSPEFRRAMLALFSAGFSTFAVLYFVQPLLPVFATTFHVNPAQSSLPLSLTTGILALGLLLGGAAADRWGRRQVMRAALFSSALLTLLVAIAPNWPALLLLRLLTGLALSGLPGIMMTYIAEEFHHSAISTAVGLLIGRNAAGGLAGRIVTGILTDYFSWRTASAAIGCLGLAAALYFSRALPPPRHSHPQLAGLAEMRHAFATHLRDRALRWLFVEGFLLMASFVTVFNYISFRLRAPQFGLSHTAVASVFLVYVAGIAGSPVTGRLAACHGLARVLPAALLLQLAGLLMMVPGRLWLIIPGLLLFTSGFFAAHTVTSSWVGRQATVARAHAASLYLTFYYVGGSVIGTFGGYAWTQFGWNGISLLIASLLVIAWRLARQRTTMPNSRAKSIA